MQQIRLTKTPELKEVLSFLQRKYPVMSEAEIIKMALSEKYNQENQDVEKQKKFKRSYDHLMSEGKKLGDKLLAKKGLKRKDVSEEQFYNLIIDPKNA